MHKCDLHQIVKCRSTFTMTSGDLFVKEKLANDTFMRYILQLTGTGWDPRKLVPYNL